MLLDGIGLDIDLLLLLDEFGKLADDLIRDVFYMLSAAWSVYPIHERDVCEFVCGGETYNILPTRVGILVDAFHAATTTIRTRSTLRANIQIDILLKMTHRNKRAIVFHFHGLVSNGGDIVGAFQEKRGHVWRKVIGR